MKTTLAILITGLIFLATPMLATAHGGDRHHAGPKQKQYKSWAKQDRHDHQAYRNDRLQPRINTLERKQLRETAFVNDRAVRRQWQSHLCLTLPAYANAVGVFYRKPVTPAQFRRAVRADDERLRQERAGQLRYRVGGCGWSVRLKPVFNDSFTAKLRFNAASSFKNRLRLIRQLSHLPAGKNQRLRLSY